VGKGLREIPRRLRRLAKGPRDRHILKDAPLTSNSQGDDVLPHPLAIAPCQLDQLIKPAGSLEERIGKVEREGGAISLVPDFEIVEEPADVGEEEVADLGLLVERGLDFRERILEIPMLVGKGKRGADLLKARRVLPLAQKPIRFQSWRTVRRSTRCAFAGHRSAVPAIVDFSRELCAPAPASGIRGAPADFRTLEVHRANRANVWPARDRCRLNDF
jgi:hypothetical protein